MVHLSLDVMGKPWFTVACFWNPGLIHRGLFSPDWFQ